ncbi:MAG: crosslink repair DNA glycosylase YcaQ family protein [bacterium]
MTDSKLRAWWWARQGLDGSLIGSSPSSVLERSGWARSVGGVGPYLTLFARARISRADADAAVAGIAIHELPAARGCTYVLPARDFAVGLTVAQAFGDADMRLAAKLGVPESEIDALVAAVLGVLGDEPLDPDGIKTLVGGAVRNLGDEGKKKGMITTLPVALGWLQARGEIRRVPVGGRLDQQRYRYVRWSSNPLASRSLTRADAYAELARLFFRWVGPATMAEFQWFSGLGVKAAKDAVATLSLAPVVEGERLLLPEDVAAFASFQAPDTPSYALVSSLDAISAARREVMSLVDESDRATIAKITLGTGSGGNVADLAAHAILDRGRLIGYWEYDSGAREIVWILFGKGKKDKGLLRAVDETESFVRDQLGDARSFSLDSPKSRQPKIEALRTLAS